MILVRVPSTDKINDDSCSSNSNDDEISQEDEGFETSSKAESNNNTTTLSAADKLLRRETRFVRCLRLGLVIVLLSASAIASASIYKVLASHEQGKFEEAFLDYSSKITSEFQTGADRCLGAVAAFSTVITSNALLMNATWPFVTISHYEAQVRHIVELANLPFLVFAPIVAGNERKEWENYFVPQHVNEWIKESLMSMDSYDGPINDTMSIAYSKSLLAPTFLPDANGDGIDEFSFAPSMDQVGPFLPIYQSAPFKLGFTERSINIDMNPDVTFDHDVISSLSQHKSALGRYTLQGFGEWGNGAPTSSFYYPVLKDLPRNSTVGGTVGSLFNWLPFFSNILPKSAVGIIGVVSNTCNQTFAFRIDGPNVTFLGENDQHDVHYDYLKQEVSFQSLLIDSFDNKQYLGFPLDDTGCSYMLSIYPSSDLYKKYVTDTPMIASILILLVFLGTSSIFLLYDRLVERRQRMVQKEAESSGAIVSSLFPAAYHERLMAAQVQGNKANTKESLVSNLVNGKNGEITAGHDKPIADLYQNCTVFFADIAGFTRWSSIRDPVQVFHLLQEVFAAMDKVAKKYRVFKVETIGDCYMAVTGLPNPQKNHATLMSRFATDCLVQMRDTTTRLMGTLGDDTADLTLRIGLHSGPVTAGILLGEKSRFQLFGDTVNTASRMESTGEIGRIQVSSATADVLREDGKGHWLQTREDLVEAKGKGTLQTFWLVVARGQSTGSRSNSTSDLGDIELDTTATTPEAQTRVLVEALYDV